MNTDVPAGVGAPPLNTTYSSYIVGERQNSALSVQAAFVRTTYLSRDVYFRWSRAVSHGGSTTSRSLTSVLKAPCVHELQALESPLQRLQYIGNFVAEHNFFLRNIIAVRNFDRPLIAALSLHKIHKAAIHHVHFFNMLNYVSEIYESYTLQAVLRSLQCHGSVS